MKMKEANRNIRLASPVPAGPGCFRVTETSLKGAGRFTGVTSAGIVRMTPSVQ